ncbi:HAD family hydrolase [Asaia siamensis]|uniref:Haloacid dehalogenase n=1 Tax=Asaia siamensis TaxID=110479 RepID=A0ABQ1L6P1_9PROT|nr:HAD family phosphatase [Asaia siamensis]GBR09325.1 phosphatase/phosphohexomutase [Asaia siamensis NRIC 0323]GGC20346.1 haloacid dehalogenase [Asaia siamensis]
MTGPGPIRGILFDMDGVLLDSESLSLEAFVMAARDLGHDMPLAFARQMIGLPGDACARLVVETYGPEVDLEALFRAQDKRLHDLVEAGGLILKQGVEPLLDYLDARKLPRAIATSSSRLRTETHLRHVGIYERFDAIITRDDVTRGKPDPEPYLRAAAAIGIEPAYCLAIEDSHNGARAAHAAGIRVIVVPDLMAPNEEIISKAHAIMDNLHEVRDFIECADSAA